MLCGKVRMEMTTNTKKVADIEMIPKYDSINKAPNPIILTRVGKIINTKSETVNCNIFFFSYLNSSDRTCIECKVLKYIVNPSNKGMVKKLK